MSVPSRPSPAGPPGDESAVWSIVGTLLAGPAVWGAAGYGLDVLLGTERLCTALGILLGFGTAMYIVYVRYGRD